MKALERGISIAKQEKAELTIMSIAPEFQDAEDIPMGYSEKIKNEAVMAVTRAATLARESGVDAKTRVEVGASPADNIVTFAEESKTDLIVLGHRGMSRLGRFLVGSVAGKVVTYAPCSVLVVR